MTCISEFIYDKNTELNCWSYTYVSQKGINNTYKIISTFELNCLFVLYNPESDDNLSSSIANN